VAVSFKLSAFHTCFNVCNVLILICFVHLIEKTVCKIVPP
jgi:phosphate:Na+ symporter